MRRFRVHINGRSYDVEVEELGGSPGVAAPGAASQPQTTPAPNPASQVPVPTPERSVPTSAAAATAEVTAPLPGLILEVLVSPGQSVSEDDVLVVLEAMKMENELTAPQSGTIKEVRVQVGATVNQGDVLVVFE